MTTSTWPAISVWLRQASSAVESDAETPSVAKDVPAPSTWRGVPAPTTARKSLELKAAHEFARNISQTCVSGKRKLRSSLFSGLSAALPGHTACRGGMNLHKSVPKTVPI